MAGRKDSGVLQKFGHGHIDTLGLASVLFVYVVAGAFLAFPTRLAKSAQTAAWTVPIFSGVLCALWLAPLVYVHPRYPGKTIVEITRDLAGKAVAAIFGVFFFVANTGMVCSIARQLCETLTTVVVPLTPITFTLTVVCATGIYLALKGTEILSRLSIIITVATILNVTLSSALTYHAWHIDDIYPLLGPGLPDLAKSYFIGQTMYLELMALGILAPYLRKRSSLGKATLAGTVLSMVMLSLVTLTCLMMFPYPSLTRVHLPFLRTVRIIYLSRFLQRFDAVFVVIWLSAGTLFVAIGAWINSHLIASLTGLGAYRIGVLISGVLILAGAFLPSNIAEAISVHSTVIRTYSLLLLYPWSYTLLVLQLMREKKRKTVGGSGTGREPHGARAGASGDATTRGGGGEEA